MNYFIMNYFIMNYFIMNYFIMNFQENSAQPVAKNITIRNIILFTALVNGLAWLGPVLGGDPTTPGPGLLIWGTAPTVAALLMKFLVRDDVWLGFRPRIQGNGGWYLLSLALYPVAIAMVLGIGLFSGASTLHNFTLPAFAAAMMPLAITFFLFALFEEVGWRGYLAPKVYGLHGGLLGHLFVGLIWASWHFPYMRTLWAHTAEGMETLLPRFIVGTIISAIVYGEIRLRTGSVWPAVLMHGVGNTLANTLLAGLSNPENADRAGFVTLLPGKEWLSSFGVEGALMMLIFGVVGTVLYVQRSDGRKSKVALVMQEEAR